MFDITNPIFKSENKARKHLESVRWPDGPQCPHCGKKDATKLKGKMHRPGLYQCNKCREQFTVTVGTVFERSKVPLHKWLLATYLLSSSKKGISTHQIHRTIGVTYKTAWFMTHRIREAMRDDGGPMGGEGKTIEADETYIGRVKGRKFTAGALHKQKVLSLVERGGKARSFHISNANMETIYPILTTNVKRETRVFTDDARYYEGLRYVFHGGHWSVNHSAKEYGRGEIHTNTIEGFFSIFKRGMKGIYQHCAEKHLHRYLAEFDFRYNHHRISDWDRSQIALKGIEGKRLTYRRIA